MNEVIRKEEEKLCVINCRWKDQEDHSMMRNTSHYCPEKVNEPQRETENMAHIVLSYNIFEEESTMSKK